MDELTKADWEFIKYVMQRRFARKRNQDVRFAKEADAASLAQEQRIMEFLVERTTVGITR